MITSPLTDATRAICAAHFRAGARGTFGCDRCPLVAPCSAHSGPTWADWTEKVARINAAAMNHPAA